MQRESYYNVLHFLDDPSFRDWVLTGIDDNSWNQWLEVNPDKVQFAREARNILLAMGRDGKLPGDEETDLALEDSWARIRRLDDGKTKVSLRFWYKFSAAMMVAALGLAWYFFLFEGTSVSEKRQPGEAGPVISGTVEILNDTEVASLINLEDGSSVLLQPGGKLSYLSVFEAAVREVHLSGEAFFEISKDPARPFLVYTHDIVTKVVGTSFGVKAIEGQPEVEVFVKTGEVNVRHLTADQDTPTQEIAVLPNEFVSFRRERKTFEKSTQRVIPKRAIEYLTFEFVDKPVNEIFKTIETAYGLSVVYPKLLDNCHLSTFLNDEPLLEKLKIICESLGENSTFDIKDNVITIHSNGCN